MAHPYARSATLVCVECPTGFEFGVDLTTWTTGANFRGLKLLPPGTHVFTSAARAGVPVTAFFLHVHEGDTRICRWDRSDECLVPHDTTEAGDRLVVAIHAGLQSLELDPFLGAFPTDKMDVWRRLTRFIAPAVIDRLQPIDVVIHDVASGDEVIGTTAATATVPSESAKRVHSKCYYSSIPGTSSAATPAERTQYGVDTSPALRHVWKDACRAARRLEPSAPATCGVGAMEAAVAIGAGPFSALLSSSASRLLGIPAEGARATTCPVCRGWAAAGGCWHQRAASLVCGELQFAFLSFIVAQSYTAFLQWKHLVDVLCRCEDAQLSAQRGCPRAPESKEGGSEADGFAAVPCDASAVGDPPLWLLVTALDCVADQLPVLPADFFSDELSKRNFLGPALTALVRTATTRLSALDSALLLAVLRLCAVAEAVFAGWEVPGAEELRALAGAKADAERMGGDGEGSARGDSAHAAAQQAGLFAPVVGGGTGSGVTSAASSEHVAAEGLGDRMHAGAGRAHADKVPAAAAAAAATQRQFAGMAELLDALRADGGDDDLPAMVLEDGTQL